MALSAQELEILKDIGDDGFKPDFSRIEDLITRKKQEDEEIDFDTLLVDGNPFLFYVLEKGGDVFLEFFLKQGANPNVRNKDGLTLLMVAASKNKESICKILVENGADVSGRGGVNKFSAVEFALSNNADQIAIYLALRADFDLTEVDNRGLDALTNAYIINAEKFLDSLVKDRDNFNKVMLAVSLLNLTYSQDDFGSFVNINTGNLETLLLDPTTHEIPQKADLLSALKIINNPELFDLPMAGKIEVVKLLYKGHVAFVVIEYDENNIPKTLSYCDGNLPTSKIKDGYGYGEISFKINRGLVQDRDDLLAKISLKFADETLPIYTQEGRFNSANFDKALAQIVVCDENGKPEIQEQNSPTKPQKRGNCSMKSLRLVMKALHRRVDPTLIFEEADKPGVPGGSGYELYKKFTKTIIAKCLDDLLEMLDDEKNKTERFYPTLLETAKSVFLQAAAKNDISLMDRLKVFLPSDLNALKSREYGENALFIAAKRGNIEAFKWCLENGVKNEPNALKQNMLDIIAAKNSGHNEMLLLFLKHHPEATNEIVASALKNNRLDIVKIALDANFDPNSKNSKGQNMLLSYVSSRNSSELAKILLNIDDFVNSESPEGIANGKEILTWVTSAITHQATSKTADLLAKELAENKEILATAIEKGASVEALDAYTALITASLVGDAQAAKCLLEGKFFQELGITDPENCAEEIAELYFLPTSNPVNIALENGDAKMIQVLLSNFMTPVYDEKNSKEYIDGKIANLLGSTRPNTSPKHPTNAPVQIIRGSDAIAVNV